MFLLHVSRCHTLFSVLCLFVQGLVSGLSQKTLEAFPRVTEGLKKAFYCDVTPGYVLFLPSLWLHTVFMLPPLHELCHTCRATIRSRTSSSSSTFSSFFSPSSSSSSRLSTSSPSSSPSPSGSLCSSSSASGESTVRDSSIQTDEKQKNNLLDGEEEEACCVSVNVFFLDRSLPCHEKVYAKKDIYGNKVCFLFSFYLSILLGKSCFFWLEWVDQWDLLPLGFVNAEGRTKDRGYRYQEIGVGIFIYSFSLCTFACMRAGRTGVYRGS